MWDMFSRETAPGPSRLTAFTNLRKLNRDPDRFFEELSKYGPLVEFPIFTKTLFLFNDPELFRLAMVDPAYKDNYQIAQGGLEVLGQLIGTKGVLTITGPEHKAARKSMHGSLHGEGLDKAAVVMQQESVQVVKRLQVYALLDRPVDIVEQMYTYTMSVLGRAVLGADLSEYIEATRQAVERGLATVFPKTQDPFGLPLWLNRQFKKDVLALNKIVNDLIDERLRIGGWETGQNVMSVLLRRYKSEEITHEEVVDNLINMLVAGHETTATALVWLWYALSKNSEVYDFVAEESALMLGKALTVRDRPNIKKLLATIDESMRLYPTAPRTAREVIKEHYINGIRIPKGAIVFFSNRDRQLSKDLWGEDADAFKPERFLDDATLQSRRWAFSPFGGGNRRCLGEAFALYEMATLLKEITASGIRLEVSPDQGNIRVESGFTRKIRALSMKVSLSSPIEGL